MRFEPAEQPNSEDKDNSIQFCLRSSITPALIELFLCLALIFAMLFFHHSTRFELFIRLIAVGLWVITFLAFNLSMIAYKSTLVFATRFRLCGQVFAVRPSHRLIEVSLAEIRDVEVRATLGTRFFKYAHVIIYPERGKKITLRHIRYAEERAVGILKLQEQLRIDQPDAK